MANLIHKVAAGELTPQIGMWYAYCCAHDLDELKTEEAVAGVLFECSKDEVEEVGLPTGLWLTKEEAIDDLLDY